MDYSSVTAEVGTLSGSVTEIKSVVVDAQTGVTAKGVFALDADGKVVGVVATNDGTLGAITFVFDSYSLLRPDGTVLLTNDGGTLQLHDVEIDTLKVNTAIVPIVVTSTTDVAGNTSATSGEPSSVMKIFSRDLVIDRAGLVRIEFEFAQRFTSGLTARPWMGYVAVNGTMRPESKRHGEAALDACSCVGYYYAPAAGTYTITAHWNAHTTVHLDVRSFAITGLPGSVPPTDEGDGGDYSSGSGGGGSGGGGWDGGAEF